jgi:hypothetical protein
VPAALFDHTVRGALFPESPHHKGAEIGLRLRAAALGDPLDKRHILQTFSGRRARDATRPENQLPPPHIINLPRLFHCTMCHDMLSPTVQIRRKSVRREEEEFLRTPAGWEALTDEEDQVAAK